MKGINMFSQNTFTKSLVLFFLFCTTGFTQDTYDIRNVDFENYTYKSYYWGGTIRLVRGKEKDDACELVSINYIPFDTIGNEAAVVILEYGNKGGNAGPIEEFHVFSNSRGKVKEEYGDCQQSTGKTKVNEKSIIRSYPIWLNSDAHCCPSFQAYQTIQFENGVLKNKIRKVKNK